MLIEIYKKYRNQRSYESLVLYKVDINDEVFLTIPIFLHYDKINDLHEYLIKINDLKFCVVNYKRIPKVSLYNKHIKNIIDYRIQYKNEEVEIKVYE